MPKRVRLGLFLAAILLYSGLFSTLIAAQDQQSVELLSNEAQAEFPSELSFHLEVKTTSPPEAVELEYGVEKVSCEEASVRIAPDVTEEGEQPTYVRAEWTWDFRRSGSLPPGARIWWIWHITTSAGESWSSPRDWITFNDDHHDWQDVTQGQITVHWYDGDQAFGQLMLQTAVEAQARLTADPGSNLERAIHLYFYATSDDLRDALVFSQRWTGGLAFTDFYTVLIAANPQSQTYGERTAAHELMHLVVDQLAFNCWSFLPRWLDEGLASWAEGDLAVEQQELLDEAIAEDELLSLRSLSSSFSAHSSRAYLSYAQSYSVVVFLIDEYGREEILELLAVFREGASYDGALEQVYGFDTDGLEDLWRASIGAQPRATTDAPVSSPTPAPTLSLWVEEPTSQTAVPAPTVSPQPTATETPLATAAPETSHAPEASPAPSATALDPTPIGDTVEDPSTDNRLWYVAGGGAVLAVLLLLVLVGMYARRR